MTDALALVTLAEAQQLANSLAPAETLPAALRKRPADVLLAILSGRSLGLDPTQSLRAIHIIEGRVTLSADAMAALCKRSPLCEYLQCKESSDARATFVTKRRDEPEPTSMSFTIDQAKTAGLVGKGNWAKYPAAMLRARALSALCRLVYPDLLLGTYDPDEVEREERDVTPVASTSEPRPTPPQAADITTLKAATKKRRALVIDVTPVVAPEAAGLGPLVVDGLLTWPPNYAGKFSLEKLGTKALNWSIAEATKLVEAGGDQREAWLERLTQFTDEYARRTEAQAARPSPPSEAVAEGAVSQ